CVIRQGTVFTAANLDHSLIGVDIQARLRAAIGQPVICLNDADAAGVAELRWGAARGARGTVMVLTFGTGIGSALFVDGRLVPNTELGHLEVGGAEGEQRASARVRTEEKLDWAQWASRVEEYLQWLERLLWPDLIILGGGVSRKADKFLPLIRLDTPLVPAALQNDAGKIG